MPDRRDRQLAASRRARGRTRSSSNLAWDTLPPQTRGRGRGDASRHARRRSRGSRRSRPPGQGGVAPPPWSAAHPVRQSATRREARDRHGQRQLPPDRRRRVGATSGTSCSTSARLAFPVLEGQTIGIVPPGTDASGRAAPRAPVLDREPARRRAAALQQRRADREARHRGPRRQRRSPASRRITCATSTKGDAGQGGRTLSARAS